jgi:hypothetical protein
MTKKLDNISYGKPSAGPNPLKASQSSNVAKIRTDVEETKFRLKNLAKKWKGINSVKGFLTDLWIAIGVEAVSDRQRRGGNPSRYAAFEIDDDMIVTIRASSHNADAKNYSKEGNINGDSNLSIVLQKRWHKSTFKADAEVEMKEYVYTDSKIAEIKDPLSQIADSLIGYLDTGNYVDTTGAAILHESLQR